jgi:sterol desaturase/sphingolipid hydroxylase (fatty acid hydroxylase superfamily)
MKSGIDFFSLEIITATITAAGAITLIILERIFPYTKGQKFFREGFFNDFFLYTIFQSYILGLVITWFCYWLADTTNIDNFGFIREWPLALQVLFFLITHDFYIYWFHRYQHNSEKFWRLHEAHHSTHDVDWLSGTRSHSLEIMINQTIEFAPIILFGSPEVALLKGTLDALWGMYIHSNIDVRSGRLQYIINGPEMHRWHHAIDEEAHNKNFSTKFAWWDWMFGTAYFPHAKKPSGYGLSDPQFPKNYIKQHLYAFRKGE